MAAFLRRKISYILLSLTIVSLPACKKDKKKPDPGMPPTPTATVTSLNIDSGPYNTMVQLKGTLFNPDQTKDVVYFNGIPAKVTYASETTIIAYVPLSAGTGKVTLVVDGAAPVTGPMFTYMPTLMVTTYAGTNPEGIYDNNGEKMGFYTLRDLTIDLLGNVYTTDTDANSLEKIDAFGKATLYWGTSKDNNIPAYNYPYAITTDIKGYVYVVDYGYVGGSRIRKIAPDGSVKMIPLKGDGIYNALNGVAGIVVDANGTIFLATDYSIKKVSADGVITGIAGGDIGFKDGPGNTAQFQNLNGLTMDKSGNLYTIDLRRIRKITKDGVVSTFAGSETGGAKNGVGTLATFEAPIALVTDVNNNIYVADPGTSLIRKITPERVVTTYAGTGKKGTTDGIFKYATFSSIFDMNIDAKGILYTSEDGQLVRKVGLQ
jgi:hypothetical protein